MSSNLGIFRIVQQVRLWIYVVLIVVGVSNIREGIAGIVVMFAAMVLIFLEFCPECGKPCWNERGFSWGGPLFIGGVCKNRKDNP